MPELPEVEVLVRHLAPLLKNKTIRGVDVRRLRVIAPTPERELVQALQGAKFTLVSRRGKYLLFTLRSPAKREPLLLLGHLGMTGRIYLLPKRAPLPKHAAVVMDLGRYQFVYEDTRYFGRLTLDQSSLTRLGPEPLGPGFTPDYLTAALRLSSQAIKVRLLDQTLVAGIGNIYAGEALFRAGISPRRPSKKLNPGQVNRLWEVIREVLAEAIALGSSIPLNFAGTGGKDGLFYYGAAESAPAVSRERFLVYDRFAKPCSKCGNPIKRLVQAARSTFYCPRCQPA
ncbi:MAG: Formamidopyrimidine-DNA glycosylase [Pedosphaera sp.]|nr:Formamidopyrimidine-DNA glycosylase [Pedosphaera sp.]